MCPWCTAVSSSNFRQAARRPLRFHKYSIHTYIWLWQTESWEKDAQYSLLLCNLQLSYQDWLSVHTGHWISKSRLKTSQPHHSGTSASLGLAHFSLEVFFSSLFRKLVFAMGKASDASLCPYQELRPMRKGLLWLSLSGNNTHTHTQRHRNLMLGPVGEEAHLTNA